MHCPRCHHENSGDNRFCEGCGHAFTHTCAACGRILGPAARFCGGCGNEVEAPGLTTEADLPVPQDYLPGHIADRIRTARGGLEGERKRVTVLFADIKGSLELIHGADPEEAQRLLDGAIRRMMEAVHRYEGTVNKVLGDGVMALFGAPIAHEDHAVRACYAALAMQESIRRSADEVRRAHGIELLARVGINSGEVVVRGIGNDLTMDYDAIGETTHLAARMEQLAAPGTIRMTGSVLELAEAYVQVRDLGPIPVKGLERPVDAYELTGVTTLRTRFQATLARGLTEFVGRGTETDLLAEALRLAAGGEGRVVSIIGEPGVGKSRLFYEFIRSRATEGWLVLESGSVSYGRATSYMPVIDLLRCYFGIERGDDSRRIRERVFGKLLTLDEDLRALATPILGLIDAAPEDPEWEALDAPQRRRQMLDAVRSLLLRESAVQPVVLLFEDLHWIDAETQAFLDSLVESLRKAPILLLVNYRPEYGHGWGSKPHYTQRRIDALPPASATDLLTKVLGADASLASLKEELITRTAGNPLFLEESVRALVEAGALSGSPGDYRLAVDTFSIEVPATVQSVLAARIDRLALPEKQLLQTAAVVGKDVDYRLLLAVAGLPEEKLRQSLTALQAAEFMFETRLFPHSEYTFKHALTHDVAYRGILAERRRTLHRSIAEHLEREPDAGSRVQPERLAHHWTEAGVAAKAVECWRRAGRRALERSANREAVVNLEKGLGLLPALPEGPERKAAELDFCIGLGVARSSADWAGAPAAGEAFERACALSEEIGDVPEAFSALWGLWRHRRTCRDFTAARGIADRLSAIATEHGDRGLALQAGHAQWSTALYFGDWAGCLEHCNSGVDLYDQRQHHAQVFRFGSHDPCTCAHATAAISLTVLGELEQAALRLDEAVRIARALNHPETLVQTLGEAVNIHLLRREVDLAVERGAMALEVMREYEFAEFYPTSSFVECWRAVRAGDLQAGVARAREGFAARKAAGINEEAHALVNYADLLVGTSEAEEGLAVIAGLRADLEGTGVRHMDAELARLTGVLLQRLRGDADREAEACLEDAIGIAREQGARLFELRTAMDLARLREAQGRPRDGREILSPIAGRFAEESANEDVRQARALIAELA